MSVYAHTYELLKGLNLYSALALTRKQPFARPFYWPLQLVSPPCIIFDIAPPQLRQQTMLRTATWFLPKGSQQSAAQNPQTQVYVLCGRLVNILIFIIFKSIQLKLYTNFVCLIFS